SVPADAQGRFSFTNLTLVPGENLVRVRVTDQGQTTVAEHNFILDQVAPTVIGVVLNNGEAQRSMLTSIAVQFSEPIQGLSPGSSLIITNVATHQLVDTTNAAVAFDPYTNTLTWTFPALTGGSLPDGNYTSSIKVADIADNAGN